MKIGYVRTSTTDQKNSLESQKEILEKNGCEKVYIEEASAVAKRPVLEEMIEYLRDGDILIVKSLDRIARSIQHFVKIKNRLDEKKVHLKILNMSIDTTTPTGELLVNVLMSVAQFEREILLERQKIGINAAKRKGKYRGRKPLDQSIKNEVIRLVDEGMQKRAVSKKMNLSETTIYRIIRENKKAA